MEFLDVGSCYFTLECLRPGGATYRFLHSLSIDQLQFMGREQILLLYSAMFKIDDIPRLEWTDYRGLGQHK